MRGFKSFLFRLYQQWTFGKFSVSEIDALADLEYMASLARKHRLTPQIWGNGILRSFLQFKCQMRRLGKVREAILNVVSIPGVLLLGLLFLVSLLFPARSSGKGGGRGKAFLLPGVRRDLVTPKLNQEYLIVSGPVGFDGSSASVKFFLRLCRRFPLSFYFLLKIGYKVSRYQFILKKYEVDAIIGTSEYSFASSALTDFLSDLGKEHVNVMHGEKLLFIHDAFVLYHRFFVWDEHYKSLFVRLMSPPEQFHLELPTSLTQKVISRLNSRSIEKEKFVYYLANETAAELERIADIGRRLTLKGNIRFFVRPHPRYTDENLVRRYFHEKEVETDLSVTESLSQANFICSLYSTVLFEAGLLSKNVVIDDVTSPQKYRSLQDLDYIVMRKEHLLVSRLLSGGGEICR